MVYDKQKYNDFVLHFKPQAYFLSAERNQEIN